MAANTGKLAGRTLFITGASRGIGLAIARKAAKDGANIVIAAKTTEPHAKLPGTIYTAAKEVEAAGGKCLPCVVDIRFEDQVKNAVEQAVQKFGGIDILINNASAINLTGTMETSMKKYDLMMGINARGTFLCSQACIPYLKNGMNPHILNLSPPLNMHVRWFKSHVAYTMAKYGMSLCALGMAEELKPFGIAVNTLWPRTAIYTAAMKMLGGDEVVSHCRKPEIVADAAYVILTKDSKTVTGNFYVDDVVLKENGVTDLEQYACIPGSKLLPDYFLDDEDVADISIESSHSTASASAAGSALKTFQAIEKLLSEDLVKSINGVFQFNLVGAEPGTWHIDMLNGKGSVGQGLPPGGCQCTMSLESEDFVKMFSGSLKPTAAFMAGKLKIEGDMGLALKLEKLMGVFQSKL